MASWGSFEREAPDFAAYVRGRIEAHGLGLLATLRSDGSPRISGIEPLIAAGELWLGMMPRSTKSLDLRRDPRLALHNATIDKDVVEGDVKLNGRAVAVDDDEMATFLRELEARTGYDATGADVYRVELTDVSSIQPAGDHLNIRSWRPGEPVRVRERR